MAICFSGREEFGLVRSSSLSGLSATLYVVVDTAAENEDYREPAKMPHLSQKGS